MALLHDAVGWSAVCDYGTFWSYSLFNPELYHCCSRIKPHSVVFFFYMMSVYTTYLGRLTLHLIETPFNAFANRVDPDQTALVRAA